MLAIKNAKIYTVTKGTIDKGTILIEDGKIKAVGKRVRVPEGCEIIDASGKCVMPGLIEAHGHLSVMLGMTSKGDKTDHNESSNPITPHVRAIDALYPYDFGIEMARRSGVTTACSLPGSVNLCGGTGVVFKLKKVETAPEMVIEGKEPMKFALGENPKNNYAERNVTPKTRMGEAAALREFLYNAKDYSDQLAKHESDPSTPAPKRDFKLDAMVKYIRGEGTCRFHCHRADDIVTAVRIAKEFGLKYVLDHVTEGYMVLDFLKKEAPQCVIGPLTSAPKKTELFNKKMENPAILANAGIEVSVCSDSGYNEFMLPIETGYSMAYGLSEEDAFRAVTINPAKVLGIDDRTGSIEVGKDADLAIFSGFPFSNLSLCEKTVIDGVVYENVWN